MTRNIIIFDMDIADSTLYAGTTNQYLASEIVDAIEVTTRAIAVVGHTSDYTLTTTDNVVISAGHNTITLPTAAGATGTTYTIKRNYSDDVVVVDTTSAETIDGETEWILGANYQSITVVSNGTNWFII